MAPRGDHCRNRWPDLTVEECKPGNAPRLIFSAMDASVATEIERAFAEAGHVVVSNSRNHRMEPDVPLLVPEINPDHLRAGAAAAAQPRLEGADRHQSQLLHRGADHGLGAAAPVRHHARDRHHAAGHFRRGLSRRALHGHQRQRHSLHRRRRGEDAAGDPEDPGRVLQAIASSRCRQGERALQPRAGGGRPYRDHFGGVLEPSPRRRLLAPSRSFARARRSATCPAPRVPVIYMASRPSAAAQGRGARARHGRLRGRLRPCPVLDWKFIALGHNTVRGAAGAAVLNAELMCSEGMLD
jgi:aspartate-semialdehyde dehydrogenase